LIEDFPVIVVLLIVFEVIVERLKNELDPVLFDVDEDVDPERIPNGEEES
jgi:hypothetical protein